MSWYFNGALHLSADIIHHIKQSCTLVAHDISSVFVSLPVKPKKRKRQLAYDKVHKCKSHPKQKRNTAKADSAFSREIVISGARFRFD